jgi:glycosyltransferase involved in cell wall biosynthesis
MRLKRLLFASCHGYLDPSSGAALCTRDMLELLCARGIDCRALSTGVLDYEQETPLEAVLDPLGVAYDRVRAELAGGGSAEVLDLTLHGVRVTLLPTVSSRADRSPDLAESQVFLNLADQVLRRFRPEVVLTYGGHPANLALMARVRQAGIPVVFHMHNFAYNNAAPFAGVNVLFPSEYTRRFYVRRIGLDGAVIPDPLRPERVVAADPEPTYLTFINPQPAKGLTVFARIACELNRRRPDIPLLVVEGRRGAEGLAESGLDLSGLTNLHRMANTPDPRQFYRVSRAVLMPSLWRETLGRVAMEALANGLPVLASDRGALPETLGEAGFVFMLPARCMPVGREVPTAREVAPWVAVVERLWDDRAFEESHRAKARQEATRWEDGRIGDEFESFFSRVGCGKGRSQPSR